MSDLALDRVSEVRRVLALESSALMKCHDRLEQSAVAASLNTAIDLLLQGDKIIVTGVGKSGVIARKIAATLSSTGSPAIYLHPTEGLHGDLGMVQPGDTVWALSHGGNSDELVKLIPPLKSLGVSIVGMGGNRDSQLARASDVWIDADVDQEACPHNLAPTSSTTLALALGDAIAVTLMQVRGFDAQKFAANHPGGSLGRRLRLRVEDVMHRGESVAALPPSATMEEVVVAATEKKLGAVLVTEGRRLVGIITDGDLRRALQHREKFFELRAQNVMSTRPIVIGPHTMAEAALRLMENRDSQISVLPVVDDQGLWLGMVRLHDLVRSL